MQYIAVVIGEKRLIRKSGTTDEWNGRFSRLGKSLSTIRMVGLKLLIYFK